MKRANKHNRLSCLISTSISFNSMLVINYCGYVVYKFVNCLVWFVVSLLYVCHKFVISLYTQTETNTPSNRNHTILELVLLVG